MGCSGYVEKRTIVRDFGSMRKAGLSPMGDNDHRRKLIARYYHFGDIKLPSLGHLTTPGRS